MPAAIRSAPFLSRCTAIVYHPREAIMGDGAVVGIGTFDGVHLGHQAILSEVRRQAAERRLTSIAYAFALPPRLHGSEEPRRTLLLPEPIKVRLLLGAVDRVLRAPFAEIRGLSPARFAETILAGKVNARSLVVGPSFRFGARRAGDTEDLRVLGARYGFSVTAVPPIAVNGAPVTSTRIRQQLWEGDVAGAAALLGRPAALFGEVVRGDRVGRELGYPTANLSVDADVLLPADGVYVVHAFLAGPPSPPPVPGLLYIGTRPTFGGAQALRCEVHLFRPPNEELYGARMEVHLAERLRGDRAFASLDQLRVQIAADVDRAMRMLHGLPEPAAPIGG